MPKCDFNKVTGIPEKWEPRTETSDLGPRTRDPSPGTRDLYVGPGIWDPPPGTLSEIFTPLY